MLADAAPAEVPADRPRRLHPASLWLPVLDTARGLLLPAVMLGFFLGPRVITFYGWGVVVSFVYYLLRYATFRYRLAGGEIVVNSGLMQRNTRHIPIERIQDVKVEQGLLHRWLGYAKVELETAASESVELVLNVVALEEAEAIKESIRGWRRAQAGAEEATPDLAQQDLHHNTLRELALGALTSQFVAFLGAAAGALFYFYGVRSIGTPSWGVRGPMAPMEQHWAEWMDRLGTMAPLLRKWLEFTWDDTFWKALAFGAAGLGFSAVAFIARYYDFRLHRAGDLLQRSFGLFTRRNLSLPMGRIQSLLLEEGLLRRWFGLASMKIDTASRRAADDEEKKHPRQGVLLPIVPRAEVPGILQEIVPGVTLEGVQWQRVSPRAAMRRTRMECVVIVLLAAMTFHWLRGYSWAWLPLFLLVYIWNREWYRRFGYAVSSDHLLVRHGWLNCETVIVPRQSLQSVRWLQNPLDRRAGMATIAPDVAGSEHTGGVPALRYLAVDDAATLLRALAALPQ